MLRAEIEHLRNEKEVSDTLLGALEREAKVGEGPATAIILRGLRDGESRASIMRQIKYIFVEGKPIDTLASHNLDSSPAVETTSSSSTLPPKPSYPHKHPFTINHDDEADDNDADASSIVSWGSTSFGYPPIPILPPNAKDATHLPPATPLSAAAETPTSTCPRSSSMLLDAS